MLARERARAEFLDWEKKEEEVSEYFGIIWLHSRELFYVVILCKVIDFISFQNSNSQWEPKYMKTKVP